MKEIKRIECYEIISEPGDMTRYHYAIYKNYDDFSIMPLSSIFNFPQRLNYYDVCNLQEEQIIELAKKYLCNPYTLMECIRTIKELH